MRHRNFIGDATTQSARQASRRGFLTAIAAAGASSLLPACAHRGHAQPAVAEPPAIDVHHHVFPPSFLDATEPIIRGASRARMVQWSAQRSLAEMDAAGIAVAIASITNPGVGFAGAQPAAELARACNEYQARLVSDNPGRFGFFAAIPLPHVDASLRAIAYAIDVLKADGIGLLTSYGDKWPGDPAFVDVFDELDRRKAVVYLHPTAPNCCRQLLPGIPDALVEFPHDTTRAIASLLYSGTFARCRNIRFIFSHAGGTIPMLAGRLTETGALFGIDRKLPNGVEFELKRLHYDIANSAHRSAFAALTSVVPMSQILFGTDYPFIPVPSTAGGLSRLGLAAGDLRAIRRENALALFPRIRGA